MYKAEKPWVFCFSASQHVRHTSLAQCDHITDETQCRASEDVLLMLCNPGLSVSTMVLKHGAQGSTGACFEDHQPGLGRFIIFLPVLYILQQITYPYQALARTAQEWGTRKQKKNERRWYYICHSFFPTRILATKTLRISSKCTPLCCFLVFAEPNLDSAIENLKLPKLASAMLLYSDRSHEEDFFSCF